MKQLFLIAFMMMNINAWALEQPKGTSYDSRIQYINYNEKDVVEINAYPGVATQIQFSPEEEILDIAAGFSQGWEFSNRRNNLYLKPKSIKNDDDKILEPTPGKWNTNLMITTTTHVYAFQLVLHAMATNEKLGEGEQIAFRLAFKYPGEDAAKARKASQERMMEKRLSQNTLPRNLNYSMQLGRNSSSIAPSMAYDDGRFTYLKFPGNREFPAVFVVNADKSEGLVNTHIDPKTPDVLVIHRVAPEMVLRLGTEVVGIFNDKYDAHGVPTTNGTTVPGIKRTINLIEETKNT